MTPEQRTRIEAAVSELIAAEIADSWADSGPPEDFASLKKDLREARSEYFAALDAANIGYQVHCHDNSIIQCQTLDAALKQAFLDSCCTYSPVDIRQGETVVTTVQARSPA